jgi:hypothetical protein
VIKAVTTNGDQLVMAAMLELILIWVYAVLLFSFFFDFYFNDDIQFDERESGDIVCRSLFGCYVTTLNFGLRAGGGIGDILPTVSYFNESKEVFFLRILIDLSFFMIIILLFFNIIFGIIIDTFASLREEAGARDEDMKNICYICGIDRQTVSAEIVLIFFFQFSSIKTLRRASGHISRRSTTCGSTCSILYISTRRTLQSLTV